MVENSNAKIVGNGLIAQAFYRCPIPDKTITIFASGVSNSSCIDPEAYKREHSLLLSELEQCQILLYFSSFAIADPGLMSRPYFQHKAEVERVLLRSQKAVILRLPNVVGPIPNPHTFVGYLHQCLLTQKKPDLWANALRYIIWVDDVTKIVQILAASEQPMHTVYSIGPTYSYTPLEVYSELAFQMEVDFEYALRPGDSIPYKHEDPNIQAIISKNPIFPNNRQDYLKRIIELYLKNSISKDGPYHDPLKGLPIPKIK